MRFEADRPRHPAARKGARGDLATAMSGYGVWADGRSGSPLIPHVRLRDFEATMCRACYLTT
jgi:hypothetical protein